jgi:hypothetical protein
MSLAKKIKMHQFKDKNYQNSKYMKQARWKKNLKPYNVYSCMQLELKYKHQINNFFLKKRQTIRDDEFFIVF